MHIIFIKHVSNFLERMMFICFHKQWSLLFCSFFNFSILFLFIFFQDISFENVWWLLLSIIKLSWIAILLMFGKIIGVGEISSTFMLMSSQFKFCSCIRISHSYILFNVFDWQSPPLGFFWPILFFKNFLFLFHILNMFH